MSAFLNERSSFEEKESICDSYSNHDYSKFDSSWDEKADIGDTCSSAQNGVTRIEKSYATATSTLSSPVTSESDYEIPPPPPDSSDFSDHSSFCDDGSEDSSFSNWMKSEPHRCLSKDYKGVGDDVSCSLEKRRYAGDCSYDDLLNYGDGKYPAIDNTLIGDNCSDYSNTSGKIPICYPCCVSDFDSSEVMLYTQQIDCLRDRAISTLFRLARMFALRCGFDHWKRAPKHEITSSPKIHEKLSYKKTSKYSEKHDALRTIERVTMAGVKRLVFARLVSIIS